MMRAAALLIACLLVICLPLSAAAYDLDSSVLYPYIDKQGKNTMALGVLKIAGYGLSADDMARYVNVFNGHHLICFVEGGRGHMVTSDNPCLLLIRFETPPSPLRVDYKNGELVLNGSYGAADVVMFHYPSLNYYGRKHVSMTNLLSIGKLVRSSVPLEVVSQDGSDCVVNVPTGGFTLIDDRADASKEDSGGILGWLADFWDKLKDFFLSLFVPREGFFGEWFEELRSAFDSKLGGLGDVIAYIKGMLTSAVGMSDIRLVLPDNMIFEGAAGTSVSLTDLLEPVFRFLRPICTGFVTVVTAYICYRRVIDLANT